MQVDYTSSVVALTCPCLSILNYSLFAIPNFRLLIVQHCLLNCASSMRATSTSTNTHTRSLARSYKMRRTNALPLPISARFETLLRKEANNMRIHFAHTNNANNNFFYLTNLSLSLHETSHKRRLNKRLAYKALPTLFLNSHITRVCH